jgi:hypothetical protein
MGRAKHDPLAAPSPLLEREFTRKRSRHHPRRLPGSESMVRGDHASASCARWRAAPSAASPNSARYSACVAGPYT